MDNYELHKQYYELYTKNNTLLNEIIQNSIIKTYNFDFNPKKYYRLSKSNIITRNIYELSGIIIMLNAIIEKTFYGFCIKTGKKYKCEKMHCSNSDSKYGFYTYHFNCSKNEFIIMFSWEYFSPTLIYYTKTKDVYNINYRYSDIKNNINDLLNNTNHNITYYPKDKYVSYVVGIIHNAGHYFWQEICGLMILIENNLISNIDEFIIYNFDYLNIGNILKNKFKKKITYLALENNNNLTVNLTKHYINNSSIELFKNIYDIQYIKKKSKVLNILFDIRSNRRIWLNQNIIMLNVMNGIKYKYTDYSVNFYISGFYNYENNTKNTFYNKNKEITTQNKIFYDLQSKLSFPIINLINVNLSEIIKILPNIDLCIANVGSGVSFFYSVIFNKPMICFTTKKNSQAYNLQRYACENKSSNTFYINPNNIIDINDNFILKNGILYNLVLDKITKIINNKQNEDII